MKKILFLIAAIILAACSAPPQVIVTSAPTECCAKVTVTLTPPSTEIPAPVLTETPAPTTAPTAETESLAAMTDEQKLDSAPSVDVLQQDGQISADIDPTQIKIQVEAGHYVTYSLDGEHVAAYNLQTGETYGQLAYHEFANGENLIVTFDNDWDFNGYTPELDIHKDLVEKVRDMVRGSFAVNWGLRQGLYKETTENGKLTAPGYDLRSVANRNVFYAQVLLPAFDQAVAEETLFAGDGKIPMDGYFVTGQLPEVHVVFEYNAENTTKISTVNGLESMEVDNNYYRWVEQKYDEDSNTLTITIGMDPKLVKRAQSELVGGPILGSLRDLTQDRLTSNGIHDMSGQPLLDALDVPDLGPNKESARQGNLSPDSIVKLIFEGLDPEFYNR